MSSGLSCGANLMRMLLFLFTFVFWISGVVLFAIGLWFKLDPEIQDYMDIANEMTESDQLRNSANLLIAVGFFILVIGFLGCCGACKASSWMLCGFTILVTIIIIMELGVIGLAVAYRGEVDGELKKHMLEQVQSKVSNDLEDPVTLSWNIMQAKLSCCGVESFKDYKDSNFSKNNPTAKVPPTCCVISNLDDFPKEEPEIRDITECIAEVNAGEADKELHSKGCYSELKNWLEGKGAVLIAAVLVFIVLQIIGCVFALKVRREILETQIA